MYYYEQLENGDIGRYTNNANLAQKYNWTGQTETEPIMYNNKLYLQSDYESLKESDEYKSEQAEIEKQQKLAALEAEYKNAVNELQSALAVAQLRNDTALIADIQSDFNDLQESYQTEKEAIENGIDNSETV